MARPAVGGGPDPPQDLPLHPSSSHASSLEDHLHKGPDKTVTQLKQDPGDLGLNAIQLSSGYFWTPIWNPYLGPLWVHLKPFGPIKT